MVTVDVVVVVIVMVVLVAVVVMFKYIIGFGLRFDEILRFLTVLLAVMSVEEREKVRREKVRERGSEARARARDCRIKQSGFDGLLTWTKRV